MRSKGIECFECGIVKIGCKPIKFIVSGYERFLGKMVCRSCNNFSERFTKEYSTSKTKEELMD